MRRRNSRPGFTLLELTLVLALLSAMAAMAWPMLHGALARQRLYSAGEQIRAVWMNARLDAMTSGLIHVFRYDPATMKYWVETWEGFDSDLEWNDVGGLTASSGESNEGLPANAEALPEGVTFSGRQQDLTIRDEMALAQGGSGAGGEPLGILFYSDGTTSNVTSFGLTHEDQGSLTLSMHGMTGIVSISQGEATEVRE
jgi:prepilin-type N-terminal cleavage/methylation domain-containing protein